MITINETIRAINSSAICTIKSEVYNLDNPDLTIEWLDGTPPISLADLKVKQAELQAEYDAQAYARKRGGEYPPLNEFAEAYTEKEFGGDSTKMDAYKIKYNKVRTENPK